MFRRALVMLALAGCTSGTPEPSEVRSHIAGDLGTVLRSAKAAKDGATANLPGAAVLGFARSMMIDAAMATDFDPDAATTWLTDKLFTDANYLGDGLYRVPAELACTTTAADGTTAIDAACVSRVNAAQFRVHVERDGDGLRFWIQVDADHDEPVGITLHSNEVTIAIDLDDASHATIALAQAMGEQAPNATLAGAITVDLIVTGPSHAKASLVIDRAIAIAVADQGQPLDGPTATRFASEPATVASLELDAASPMLNAALALGKTTLHSPASSAGNDDMQVDIAAATGMAARIDGALVLSNISLASTTSKAGAIARTLALAPFNATLTTDGTFETVAVGPALDLHTTVDHAVLGDTPPAYDVTRVLLDGSVRSADGTNQLEVMTGTLAVTTNPASFGFNATAGQCVMSGYSLGACY